MSTRLTFSLQKLFGEIYTQESPLSFELQITIFSNNIRIFGLPNAGDFRNRKINEKLK